MIKLPATSLTVFLVFLGMSFFIAYWASKRSDSNAERNITQQGLNRWLIALSAGATANSGFVVTGAVALGYSYGLYWLLLPLAWLLGDLVFWKFFPHRITEYCRNNNASTVAEIVCPGEPEGTPSLLKAGIHLLVILCLGGYTMAQWVAGQKFLESAFDCPKVFSLALFAALILGYSAIGKFKGSVYVDSFQAITRILGTFILLGTVAYQATTHVDAFRAAYTDVGPSFFDVLGGGTTVSMIGFVAGYFAASLGFGLGQPQVTSRYIASKSKSETTGAKWIYIGYVQLTWITMTLFGILLRGVNPDIADPEKGVVEFSVMALPPIAFGVILADIFGAIASTANSLLVAMAQSSSRILEWRSTQPTPMWLHIVIMGLATMAVTILLGENSSVFSLAITSVAFMASGLAPAVAIRVLGLPHSRRSIEASIVAGLTSALIWNLGGLSGIINEAAIGMLIGAIFNFAVFRLGRGKRRV